MADDDEYSLGEPPLPPDVVTVRRLALLKAGYTEAIAELLAETPGVDMDQALDLIRRGCPPDTAAKILV